MSDISNAAKVIAAGAVCWRVEGGKVRVLLVHRETRADVGLPKGKLDPGETPPQTAVREVAEETGLSIRLGPSLGSIEYTIGDGRQKIVYYWAAEVSEESVKASTFSPNAEIAKLSWHSIAKAKELLSYPRDRELLDLFAKLHETGGASTFPIIALRHAKAIPPGAWDGPDATRPLLHRGMDQASAIAAALAAFGPAKILSSPAARCLATVAPLGKLTGLSIRKKKALGQDAFEEDEARVRPLIKGIVKEAKGALLCSHSPIIPDIVEAVAKVTRTQLGSDLRRSGMLSTAEFTVMHIAIENDLPVLISAETYSPPLFD
ncbi:MAG: NUDIX hydrolase [Homoserinimonas sp.]|nr:NUDIX hydrolase [Homoserinimonas sp.]MCW5944237.1 NUDIX hydrolase [Cryobacterium sp.]